MKPGSSGSSAKKKKYYLTDIMQFVLPFVKTTTPSGASNLTETLEASQKEEASAEASVEDNEKDDYLKQMHSSADNPSITGGTQNSKENEKAQPSPVQASEHSIGSISQTKMPKRKKPLDEVDKTFVNYLKGRELQRQDTNTRKSFLISLLDETEDVK